MRSGIIIPTNTEILQRLNFFKHSISRFLFVFSLMTLS